MNFTKKCDPIIQCPTLVTYLISLWQQKKIQISICKHLFQTSCDSEFCASELAPHHAHCQVPGLPDVRGLASPLPVHSVEAKVVKPADGNDLDIIVVDFGGC